ncbi:hypothetical protein BDQ17DRAFT_1351643 [Cyathus striatus]|nr:hypothetical protein BDQ17DRAFT_1351643 [Cyathus striatus]
MPALPQSYTTVTYTNTDTFSSQPTPSSNIPTSESSHVRIFIFVGVIGGLFFVLFVVSLVIRLIKKKKVSKGGILPVVSPEGSGSSTRCLISPGSSHFPPSSTKSITRASVTSRNSVYDIKSLKVVDTPKSLASPIEIPLPVTPPTPSPASLLPLKADKDMYQIPFVPDPSEAGTPPSATTQRLWTDAKLSPVRGCVLSDPVVDSTKDEGNPASQSEECTSSSPTRNLSDLPSSGSDIGLGYTFHQDSSSSGSDSPAELSSTPPSSRAPTPVPKTPVKLYSFKPTKLSLRTVRLLATRKRHIPPLRFPSAEFVVNASAPVCSV